MRARVDIVVSGGSSSRRKKAVRDDFPVGDWRGLLPERTNHIDHDVVTPGDNPAARRTLRPRAVRRRDDGDRRRRGARRRTPRMVKRHNRLLVTFHVISDAMLGLIAFIIAYVLRFQTGLIPVSERHAAAAAVHQRAAVHRRAGAARLSAPGPLPPAARPVARRRLLRRLRRQHPRGRLRHRGDAVRRRPTSPTAPPRIAAPSKCRSRSGRSSSCSTSALTFASRELVREVLERRWRAGIGLKRILIAGSGELGRLVADKILEHRELGYQIVGFVDDRASGDHLGYRGLPLLGTIDDAAEIAAARGDRSPLRRAAAGTARADARADREHQPRDASTSRWCRICCR